MTVPNRILAAVAALALAMGPVACRRKQARAHAAGPTSSSMPVRSQGTAPAREQMGPPPLPPLSETQAQAVLPREMAALAPALPEMYGQVNALAASQGLEGWPEALWPFEDDPDPSHRVDPLKALPPAVRLIWGNVQVLWIHVRDQKRWDALVLMRVAGSREESPWRLMILKDAFGHPSLIPALPKDTWNSGNTLDWSAKVSLTYARNLDDLQKQWAYCCHPDSFAFVCGLPETDAGLSLQYDPDLGVGVQISGVANENPGDEIGEDMGWYLTPKEFTESQVLQMRKDIVWADIKGTKGVASRTDWDQWTVTFKAPPTQP